MFYNSNDSHVMAVISFIDVYFFLVVLIVKMLVIINPKITKMGHEDDIDPIK